MAAAGINQHETSILVAESVPKSASADATRIQRLAFAAPNPSLVGALRNDMTEAVHQTLRRALESLVLRPEELQHLPIPFNYSRGRP